MPTYIDVMPHVLGVDFYAKKSTGGVKFVFTAGKRGNFMAERTEVNVFSLSPTTTDLLARIGAMTDAERGDVLRMLDAVKEEA